MDWTIEQGNALFADTEYSENWMIFHDHRQLAGALPARHAPLQRLEEGRRRPRRLHRPPTSERIVEDILKWPKAVTAIIAAKGCIVPELDERKGRRKSTPMVMLHPDAASANKERRDAYMAKFKDVPLLM
mmetsp:Transcript_41322/g.113695  ORF Transcript_41322/g.113695 Transcript_41322/m.113695 type:complete len:130 (+) Transcript_41322:1022-1411(+)